MHFEGAHCVLVVDVFYFSKLNAFKGALRAGQLAFVILLIECTLRVYIAC